MAVFEMGERAQAERAPILVEAAQAITAGIAVVLPSCSPRRYIGDGSAGEEVVARR